MAFTHIFKNGPLGSDAANAIDSYIRTDTKAALNERYSLEHVALDSAKGTEPTDAAAQGRHIAGKVGVVGTGNITARNALGVVGFGALFLRTDTTTPQLEVYHASGWVPLAWGYSNFIATNAEVNTGTSEVVVANIKQLIASMRSEYKPITTVATPVVVGTGPWTYTYTIADFLGSGIRHSEVEEFGISFAYSGSQAPDVYYTMPGGALVRIFYSYGAAGGAGSGCLVWIPVSVGQTTLVFRVVSVLPGMTFLGIKQRPLLT